jgi:hypothetical protein
VGNVNRKKRKFKVIQGGSPTRRKWPRRAFALGILVVSVFLLWHSLGYISLLAAKVTVARHTEVKAGVSVQFVVARNEHVILAPGDGNYTAVVPDGNRVKVGQIYARIDGVGRTVDLEAPEAGLILHGGDGLEGALPTGKRLTQSMVGLAAQALAAPPEVSATAKVLKNETMAVIVGFQFQLLSVMDFDPQGQRQTVIVENE